MKPGRELDALIAEKVMGLKTLQVWTAGSDGLRATNTYVNKGDDLTQYKEQLFKEVDYIVALPAFFIHYSTDIAAAWRVVEKLRDSHYMKVTNEPGTYYAAFLDFRPGSAASDHEYHNGFASESTAPHAICLAALRALNHESNT